MKKFFVVALAAMSLCSCIKHQSEGEDFNFGQGVLVLCEGGMGQSNASLSFYNPSTKKVESDIFNRANEAMMGDVAQAICIRNGVVYIVMNNSGVVYALDSRTMKLKGTIENLVSPRYICFASDTKAYISDIKTAKLTVFNPQTMKVTGEVALDGVANAEEMVVADGKLFAASWSNGNKIAVVDTATDRCERTLTVGVQPYSIALDNGGTLWIVCDGGAYATDLPTGVTSEDPSMWKVDTKTFTATKFYTFASGSYFASRLATNATGDKIYFINGSVWEVDASAAAFPSAPVISLTGWSYYGLGVDPNDGNIYIADAKDYQSNGTVLRYSASGDLTDEAEVGLIPSKFAFKY